ncbi:MAG: CRISPR system precrRNA processing endoribonuclease RAMP protein Cas6 [Chloroflexi bacterium]|nr:CRISPR system precrRNA processing endoribonuclease RAMP protein Cas6 [Chloroflexota bacterium]
MNLTVYHLRFTLRADTLVHFGPQAGAQLRGALWSALQSFACVAPVAQGDPNHAQHCPMCRLMALESNISPRGVNPPRPFAIRPPQQTWAGSDQHFRPGDVFTFGISLYGDVVDLFPYVAQAVHRMGQDGVGYGRGCFSLAQVEVVNPLTGEEAALLAKRRVAKPDLPVTAEQVQVAAKQVPCDRLRLRFLTPLEIQHQGRPLDTPVFVAILGRLLERCQGIELHYTADDPTPQAEWRSRYLTLTAAAKDVVLVTDQTRWVRVQSGSRRTNSRNSVSGFVGEAEFVGNLEPFREWLVWGIQLHVGKNAVKGNGWYEIVT